MVLLIPKAWNRAKDIGRGWPRAAPGGGSCRGPDCGPGRGTGAGCKPSSPNTPAATRKPGASSWTWTRTPRNACSTARARLRAGRQPSPPHRPGQIPQPPPKPRPIRRPANLPKPPIPAIIPAVMPFTRNIDLPGCRRRRATRGAPAVLPPPPPPPPQAPPPFLPSGGVSPKALHSAACAGRRPVGFRFGAPPGAN